MKKKFILLFSIITSCIYAQDCDNVGFENGTKGNWTCRMGSYGNCNGTASTVTMTQDVCSAGANDDILSPADKFANRHTLMTNKTAMDANTGATPVACVAPGTLFPSGVNNYSFRIGNAKGDGMNATGTGGLAIAEAMKYTFVVTTANAGLTYMYAAFLLESGGVTHASNEAPRFEIKITYNNNGKEDQINCGYYNVDVGAGNNNGFLTGATVSNGTWKYTPWTKVALDLSSYIGKTVSIEFTTADCFPRATFPVNGCTYDAGGHSAYAYFDLYCAPIEIISPPVCANQASVQLCGPDGYASYLWDSSQPGIQPPYDKKCVTIKNPKAGDQYTVTMKSVAGGCPTKTTIVLKGSDFTVKNVSICDGSGPTKITATPITTGSYDWKWEPKVNLSCYDCPEPTFTPGQTTTYTVTMIDKDIANCNQVKTVTVTVGAGFTVATADATICQGEKATLTATGADSYIWQPGNLTGATISVSPTSTTTYTVTGKSNTASCPGKDVAQSIVTVIPPVTSDAGPDQNICEGQTVTLDGKFGGAAIGGSWTNGTGNYDPSSTAPNAIYTPSVAEIAAGKATLKFVVTNGTSGTCPGGMDNMDIIIDKLPTVSAGADQTICIGESATLGGSIGGSATGATWTGGAGTFKPDNKTLTAIYTPSAAEVAAGTVTLTLTTNASGKCPAKDSKTTITINKIAVVEAGPHQKICVGGSVTLAGIIGGGAVSGSWSGGTGIYSPNSGTANATYTPSAAEAAAGKVVLKFTTNDPPGPCPAVDDTMSILIDQLPVAIAGEPRSVCAGQEIKLNGKVQGAATAGTWSGGKGVFTKNNTDLTGTYTPTAQEIAAGKVTLILTTNTTGLCPADVDSVIHLINPNPIVKFAVDTPKACAPHCVDFFDSTTAGGTNITQWEWDFGKYGKSVLKNPKEICFVDPGKYDVTLTATSDKGCTTTLKKDYYIETYPKPVAAFTANPNPVTLYDPTIKFTDQSSSDVKSWTWNMGDGKIISPKTQNPVHKYEVGVHGKYIVKLFVVNDYGCVDSTYRTVEVLPEFTFFIPNAFTPKRDDGVNDTFFGKGVGIVEYHIWIFDRWGNMIFNTKDINVGWDGRANNGEEVAQQDVYVWKVKLKDVFGKYHDYIGTVTLVR